MNAAADDLEADLKPTLALSCRRFQQMAYRIRGAVGVRLFAETNLPTLDPLWDGNLDNLRNSNEKKAHNTQHSSRE